MVDPRFPYQTSYNSENVPEISNKMDGGKVLFIVMISIALISWTIGIWIYASAEKNQWWSWILLVSSVVIFSLALLTPLISRRN